MILRDRVSRLVQNGRSPAGIHERASRQSIPSGGQPARCGLCGAGLVPAHAALLLCHGIGETVEQWFGVQQFLAANGVASLVFDYSGYGSSTGRPDWDQFERMRRRVCSVARLAPDLPASVLGFSLGSGVAAATINSLDAHRLILCAAFTSFRGATARIGIPRALTRLVPPIWHAQDQLSICKVPVLVVQGEKDRMFPVGWHTSWLRCCRPRAACSGSRDHPQSAVPQATSVLLGTDRRVASEINCPASAPYDPPRSGAPSSRRSRYPSSSLSRSLRSSCSRRALSSSRSSRPSAIGHPSSPQSNSFVPNGPRRPAAPPQVVR